MQRWFAYRSFRPNPAAAARFAAAGADVACIFPGNTDCSLGVPYSPFPPLWVGPERYDWDSLDDHVAAVTEGMPDARLLCLIDLNTPLWWCRVTQRHDTFYELGRTLHDALWRRDTKGWLHAFLGEMQARYGDRMAGYILACGGTTEWQDRSRGSESVWRREAWRRWMTERGRPDPVDIPPASVRAAAAHDWLRDPERDALTLDYWRFVSESVGDAIVWYAAAAQEVLEHRVPLGVFYGYCLEMATGRLQQEAQVAYERVYACDDLDFFITPGTYQDREIGGASGPMITRGSLQRLGKRFLHEVDHRTHTARSVTETGTAVPGHREGFPDEPSTIAGLRREFALALVEGLDVWWFDMFGGWFDPPNVMAAIAQMHELWEAYGERDDSPAAEIAVVIDPDSLYLLNDAHPRCSETLAHPRKGWGRIGAPYEVYSWMDLPEVDWSGFRLIIFPALFAMDDARRELLESTLCSDGRTILWCGPAGIAWNGTWDPAATQRLTGLAPGDDVQTIDHDGWRSVLAPAADLPPSTLRAIARDAGVHLYVDTDEPVYASRRLVALHSAEGGDRRIALPRKCARVTELFTGEVVGADTDTVTIEVPAPGTVLLALEG